MLVVHVDRGWAWGAVIGCFLANFIIGGVGKAFGMILKEFEEVLESPSAIMTLTGGLIYTFMYTTSLAVHYTAEKIGTRLVMAIGAVGCCICIVVASQVQNVYVWMAFIGGGLGVFLSCIYFSSFVIIGRCFERHLGLANGISVAGISAGQAAFPSLLSHLIDTYTIRGATLIGGAVMLHFLISAVLMPSAIVPHSRPDPPSSPPSTDKTAACGDEAQDGDALLTDHAAPAAKQAEKGYGGSLDWTLLLLFIVAKVVCEIGDIGVGIMLPLLGGELGISNTWIAVALMVGGVIDFFSRLGVGWFSDLHLVRRSTLLALAWLIQAANAVGASFAHNFAGFLVCYAWYGVSCGMAMAVFIVALTDCVGPDSLSKAFAIMMVAMGVTIAPGQFFLGFIKDKTASYRWSFRTAAALVMVGAIFLSMETPIRWYRKRRARGCDTKEPGLEEESLPMTANGRHDEHV